MLISFFDVSFTLFIFVKKENLDFEIIFGLISCSFEKIPLSEFIVSILTGVLLFVKVLFCLV